MTPQQFMERVVAWPGPDSPGFINLHWTRPNQDGMFGKPFKELDRFMSFAQWAITKPTQCKEIYFCLSTQADTRRTQNNKVVAHRHKTKAIALKAIWIDIDVKPERGYATIEEAVNALSAFRISAGLPVPSAIVLSGGGLHCYWISDKPLTLDEWTGYAEGLKEKILKHGLKCDVGLTTDAARVLRVPGTFNRKDEANPRPVILKYLGTDYDFATVFAHIRRTVAATAAVTKSPFDLSKFTSPASAFAVLDPSDSLAAGIETRSPQPITLDPTQVFKQCPHFRNSIIGGGNGQSQGLWMQTVLASTWFPNGREVAHALSNKYPTYTPEETDRMYDRKVKDREESNLGWPSCKAFENEGAECKKCPFYQQIRSPLNLADKIRPPPPAPDASEADLMLPAGFAQNDDGFICRVIPAEKDNEDDYYAPLFMCKLRNPRLQAGKRRIMFETSLDMNRWGPVTVDEVDLATDQRLMIALRNHGVKPYPPNKKWMEFFMTSWMAKLDAEKHRLNTISFGWLMPPEGGQRPAGFAYGGTVYKKDGSTQEAGTDDPQLVKYYTPIGGEQPWWDTLHIVTEQHHPALEILIAAAFASPLMLASGVPTAVMCGWSSESGAHKTTSISIGAAVWGAPTATKERPMTTHKGLLHKLSIINNLPVYWDEIATEAKMDAVREILNETTEGGGGSRLKTDRTFFDYDQWRTLLTVGANTSLVQNILKNVKDTDAQLQRIFEFEVERREDTRNWTDVAVLVGALDFNYGHMGIKYAKHIGHNVDRVFDFTLDCIKKFNALVQADSNTRFRATLAGVIYAGACLANEIGCDFHPEEIWDFLVKQFRSHETIVAESEIVGGTEPNTLNAMTQFFKAHTWNTLWVNRLPIVLGAGKPRPVSYIAGPSKDHPSPIHVRCSIANGTIEISMARLANWLSEHGYNPFAAVAGLKQYHRATEGRIDLAYGAQVNGGKERVVCLPVYVGSPFARTLYLHTAADQRPNWAQREPDDLDVTAAVASRCDSL